ncbi:hypothetical protein PULV_a3167 [Pseudoalteromonas ulvae UL12]|uniref:response regulator n=1 Tax=Pseudoalteromonas ulvae TaxID=107327 RepID=UPI00186BA9B4|nr:response regulator [Pseudoalteromonas ulvae]MBE0364883.1 hypothetical protein [Pseudoalteromonas ulvae UL12]
MLTKKECTLTSALLSAQIKSHRAKLEKSNNDDERAETEKDLISYVSVLNKLRHQADKFSKKKSAQAMPRVLLVDDAPSMLAVASKLLSEIGFSKIDTTPDGDKALKLLLAAAEESNPFNIVITDWEMEGKSGLDLLKVIRTTESLMNTDVFMLTSHSEQVNILSAIEAGVTGYMLKPINFKMLNNKLLEYLPESEEKTTPQTS